MAKKEDQKGHTHQHPHNCNNMTMSLIFPITRLIVAGTGTLLGKLPTPRWCSIARLPPHDRLTRPSGLLLTLHVWCFSHLSPRPFPLLRPQHHPPSPNTLRTIPLIHRQRRIDRRQKRTSHPTRTPLRYQNQRIIPHPIRRIVGHLTRQRPIAHPTQRINVCPSPLTPPARILLYRRIPWSHYRRNRTTLSPGLPDAPHQSPATPASHPHPARRCCPA